MKIITTISILLLSLLTLQAQDQLSLEDAVRIGLENNYDLKVIRANEEVAGINNTWGNTGLMPNVSFNASLNENLAYGDSLDYRTQTIKPELTLSWVVFNGFSARINKQRFEELEARSKGNTAILVETTIQDIILAYNNCLLQKDMLSVYKELADLSEDRYNRTMDSKEIGASTTYESTQAKTSMLEDQSNYLQQKLAYDNAVRTLNFTLAVDNNKQWELISALESETGDYDLEALKSKLLSNNATLKNQYVYQSLLAKETKLEKSAYLPTLSLNAGVNNTGLGNYYDDPIPDITSNTSNAYVGLNLSWTIFNGGTRNRSVKIAQINEEIASVETSQMEHSLSNQLLQMYSSYQVNKAVLDLAKEQEESAKLNLELSKEKYQNGSINSFNYRDVQIVYMNSAISKLSAIYNLIQSNTDLLRITGGIVDEY